MQKEILQSCQLTQIQNNVVVVKQERDTDISTKSYLIAWYTIKWNIDPGQLTVTRTLAVLSATEHDLFHRIIFILTCHVDEALVLPKHYVAECKSKNSDFKKKV
jgi:hypothetical protein